MRTDFVYTAALAALCVGTVSAVPEEYRLSDWNVPRAYGGASSFSKAAATPKSVLAYVDSYTTGFADEHIDIEAEADAYADAYSYDDYNYGDVNAESYSDSYVSVDDGDGDIYTDSYSDAYAEIYNDYDSHPRDYFQSASATALADADGYITVFKKYWGKDKGDCFEGICAECVGDC